MFTNTKRVQAARRTNLKLLLSIHDQECLSCPCSGECELQRLRREYGVDNNMAFEGEKNQYEIDASTPHLIRNNSKCIKEAEYEIGGALVRVCCVSGIKNASQVLDAVKAGEKHYDFIEIMACPGGCVNGGGQPSQPTDVRNFTDWKGLRARALYDEDGSMTLRKSHDNPLVKQVYEEYLGKPGSEKAHDILHTSYLVRGYEY